MTLTKEWLHQTIAELEEERDTVPGVVNEDAAMALAAMKLALASLEAEAFGYIDAEYSELLKSGHIESCYVYAEPGEGCITLFTAPPAPVSVPDEMDGHGGVCCEVSYADGWNACRAAMLQGAENAESRCTMQPASALDSLPQNADSRCSNSPVIPDGWALVPIEPTEDMIVNGFESEPDESFSDEKEWEVYDAMSGCQQAAHRAKLCWAAMIASAPKV